MKKADVVDWGGGVCKRGAATWPALPGKEGSACQGKQGGLLERRGPWARSGRRRWMSGNHGRSVLGEEKVWTKPLRCEPALAIWGLIGGPSGLILGRGKALMLQWVRLLFQKEKNSGTVWWVPV